MKFHAAFFLSLLVLPAAAVFAGEPEPSPADSATLFEQARALLGRDNAKALALMEQASASGSADATGGLGYFYAKGIEVPKDEAKAAAYFKKGAEGGSPRAQLNYAVVLLAGQGVAKDAPAAVPWLEKSAAAAVPEAQERLGLALFHGDIIEGIGRDHERARSLLAAAAEAGLPAAQNAYGQMWASALGGPGDEKAAEDWYGRAAGQGDPKAMSNLGRLLFNSGAKDRSRRVEGLKWLLVAEALDEITAKNALNEYKFNLDGSEWAEAKQAADRMSYRMRFKAGLAKVRASQPAGSATSPQSSPTPADAE